MRTSRATLALALLVASAAVVSAVTPTYSTFTVKAGYDTSQTNVGTDATVNGYTGAVCTWCTSSRLPITSLPRIPRVHVPLDREPTSSVSFTRFCRSRSFVRG